MKDRRSTSQVITGFLPEQTVDLRGSVWKVKGWRAPLRISSIDTELLREEILRSASEWIYNGQDQRHFLESLQRGHNVEAYALEEENGVNIEEFPKQWICRNCKKFHKEYVSPCSCGAPNSKKQLPFVAYHSCGHLTELKIPTCPMHNCACIELPKGASLSQIRFYCSNSSCSWSPRPGLPVQICRCGQPMSHNLHRAAKVYTSRNVVIVNPPSSDSLKAIKQAGGVARAITWVLGGMGSRSVLDVGHVPALRRSLQEQGLTEEQIDLMLSAIEMSEPQDEKIEIPNSIRSVFEYQSKMLGIATLLSRFTVQDLIDNAVTTEPYRKRYEDNYQAAISGVGLKSVDLIEKFPIFSGRYGFTRGSLDPGGSTLNPFPHHDSRQRRVYPVYGDLAETEALLLHFDPGKVLDWLHQLGYKSKNEANGNEHLQILQILADAQFGVEASEHLRTLVHSFSHRFIRILAIYAGIDRNAIGEMIFEHALSIIIYSVPRGDFVLGGMRAVFERELDTLLQEVKSAEHRCALDPGCAKSRAACMACLHIGEPSCSHFNRQLSRKALFGTLGYIQNIS